MEYVINNYTIYAATCFMTMIVGMVCGVVRWKHMCKPFNDSTRNFYPARRLVAFFYFATILQFPYILRPHDPATWLCVRVLEVLYFPTCYTVIFRRYFIKYNSKDDKEFIGYMTLGLTPIVLMIAMLMMGHGDIIMRYKYEIEIASAIYSVALTILLVKTCIWLNKRIYNYFHNNYSNEEDIPYSFARRVAPYPILWIVMAWILFFTSSQWFKVAFDIIYTIWMVLALCAILHPQFVFDVTRKMQKLGDIEEEDIIGMDNIEEENTNDVDDDVKGLVINVVKKRYRDPHLQKPDVLADIPFGKKNDANKFIQTVGYYNLVNVFRLEHARLYKNLYPAAKQDMIAEASGFTSRYSLYSARKTVVDISPELKGYVTLNIEDIKE